MDTFIYDFLWIFQLAFWVIFFGYFYKQKHVTKVLVHISTENNFVLKNSQSSQELIAMESVW